MRKRIKLKRIIKIDKISIYIIVIILVFMSIITGLSYINKKVSPILLNRAEEETKNLSNMIINKALIEQLSEGIDIENLFTIIQNKDGEIQTVDFNSIVVNKVLSTTTSVVQKNLKAIEKGDLKSIQYKDSIEVDDENLKKGIIYEIPIGVITNNAFLSNLGPRIPVKINIIGNVISTIKTNITPYGINNALVEVLVHIEVSEQVNIPFTSKNTVVSTDIPVAVKLIQGKVPTYYGSNGLTKESNIFSIPIE
jgi:sporulation protein YunB